MSGFWQHQYHLSRQWQHKSGDIYYRHEMLPIKTTLGSTMLWHRHAIQKQVCVSDWLQTQSSKCVCSNSEIADDFPVEAPPPAASSAASVSLSHPLIHLKMDCSVTWTNTLLRAAINTFCQKLQALPDMSSITIYIKQRAFYGCQSEAGLLRLCWR